jgi:hypothetical protein
MGPGVRDRTGEPAVAAYLNAELAGLREAISQSDGERVIRIVDHIRVEAGDDIAFGVVADLLRYARNPITEPASAACIETALAYYRARNSAFW